MSDLSVVSGNEVALVRMANGKRLLVMGGSNTVQLPPNTEKQGAGEARGQPHFLAFRGIW